MSLRRNRGPDQPKHRESRSGGPRANRLLELLPADVLTRLTPHLETVKLRRGEVVMRAHEPTRAAYFPNSAVVSLISTLESGQSMEVGLVGRDGVVGSGVVPGSTTMACDGVVQVPGMAQRIDLEVLQRETATDEALRSTVSRFWHVLLVRTMQMLVCNTFHSVEQRCIRWLLTVSDLLDDPEVPLTHDLMATMLGVRRPTVTLVLRTLDRAGLIDENRGLIVIRDRAGLETRCCECYRLLRTEEQRLLGS